MKIKEFQEKLNNAKSITLGFTLNWIWKLEDNKEWIKNIVENFINNNPFWKIKYFEKTRWTKIESFKYSKHINNNSNDLIFYWEWSDWLLFSLELKLEDKYIWNILNKKLYNCERRIYIYITKRFLMKK